MADVVGRAGFHAEHAKAAGQRGAIVHEMMRELDEKSIAYWAAKNPNIVVEDEVLNEAYVNDGEGGFERCTDRRDVLEYGARRVGRVKRKMREDRVNPKTGKAEGGTITTTMIVAHLPKSMCVEIPRYYPMLDKDTGSPVLGADREPMWRSRWVARDLDEARRYFLDVLDYLTEVEVIAGRTVIPGGQEGVLGFDIQHSESTPHIQVLADTFAEDPRDADALRAEGSQSWFAHRDVRDEKGRQLSGKAKMRAYHAGLKEYLIDLGYDVSPDFDEERHLSGLGKEEYGQMMDAQREVQEKAVAVRAREINVNVREKTAEKRAGDLDDRDAKIEERAGALLDVYRRNKAWAEEKLAEHAAREEQLAAREAEVDVRAEAVRRDAARAILEVQERQEAAKLMWTRAEAAEAKFNALSARLEPVVKHWEQLNPATPKGAEAQGYLEAVRRIRAKAADIDPGVGEQLEFGG